MRTPSTTVDLRDTILDAAERLIARFGYKKMTMDDLAKEAGIGKGTTYLHFPSKAEVVLGTIDRIVERLTARLRAIAAGADPAVDRLRAMLLERVLFRFDSVRDYHLGLDELFASLRPAYLARRQKYFDAEAAVFADLLESDDLRCPDPVVTAQTLLLATNSLLPYALSTREVGRRKDVEARAGRIADLLLHGLCRTARHG